MVDQIKSLADERLIVGCVYCNGRDDTREHVPSKVFLDVPLPENLPVVGACRTCNNGFSLDEEYLACLIESAAAGSSDPEHVKRSSVAKILRRNPSLRARLEAARTCEHDQTRFSVEPERVRRVLVKLARGHAAFELSQSCLDEPASVWWGSLASMNKETLDEFESSHVVGMLGEIGSRSVQRIKVMRATLQSDSGESRFVDLVISDWVDVQDGRYRYHAIDYPHAVRIKLVIGEYLAGEVTWNL